jgi:hypothetical protein
VINMLHAWAGPGCVRELTIRFTANVFDGDAVTSGGVVQSVDEAAGERRATCEVWLDRDDGTRTVAGTAVVGLSA